MFPILLKALKTMRLAAGYVGETLKDRNLQETQRRMAYAENTSEVAKKFLALNKIAVEPFYSRNDILHEGPFLIVANHLSYLDVMVLSSLFPALFITSKEMQRAPILGQLCEAGGSIFVERRDPFAIRKDLADVRGAASTGSHIVLFPEGTSGSGETVRPFKKGLFLAAQQLGIPIMPVCIRYLEVDGKPFSEANHLKVAWYGDHSFVSQFHQFLKAKSMRVQVAFLEPISVQADTNLRMVAEKSRQRIVDFYHRGGFPKWK